MERQILETAQPSYAECENQQSARLPTELSSSEKLHSSAVSEATDKSGLQPNLEPTLRLQLETSSVDHSTTSS